MDEYEKNRLKFYLKDYTESITKKSKGGFYVCPLCGSGTGKNGTGAFSIMPDGIKWTCFKCSEGGDIYDLISKHEHLDTAGAFKRARELYGTYTPKAPTATRQEAEKREADFTAFFDEAHKDLDKTDYFLRRGISRETADRFKLGFVQEWRHPNAKKRQDGTLPPATPRLIIPTGKGSYIARDTRELKDIPTAQQGFTKQKAGKSSLFNAGVLYTASQPVFIVEGELDALSVIEAGGEAVGLGSTSNYKQLVEAVKEKPPVQPLILFLDSDEAGRKYTGILEAELKSLYLPFKTAESLLTNKYSREAENGVTIDFRAFDGLLNKGKDSNELLTADRAGFTSLIGELKRLVIETAQQEADERLEVEREEYLKNAAVNYIDDFLDGIKAGATTEAIKTGYSELDKALDGGLYEGLYIVGAISSAGKTTYILQMADQIADGGQDVLIFSLEMARSELMAKSISRNTIRIKEQCNLDKSVAKTARGIMAGSRYNGYSDVEKNIINQAVLDYREYADRLFISEGVGDIGTQQIRETVEKHIRITGNKPVVIVDYLQLIAPYSEHATDKQTIDKAVLELKRISRDFKIPVIAISSLNRAGYGGKMKEENFKESGAIEYSADVLIGLNYTAAERDGSADTTSESEKEARDMQVVIIKNRNGKRNCRINYTYYTLFNYFKEIPASLIPIQEKAPF